MASVATSSTNPRCSNCSKSGNAQVYSFNIASLALHEKLGFVREGTLRRMVYSGGQRYELVEFGMTSEDFSARYPDLASAW